MLDISDTGGLVCGYRVSSGGDMATVEWADMDAALADEEGIVWLHFNQANARARDWIAAQTRIPPSAKTLLLGTDAHMRIEPAGPGLAGVVGDLHHEFAAKSDQLDVLRLYLDNGCLISARRQPLAAVDKLRRQIGEGLKVERPVALVTQFLSHVTDTLGDLILELAETIDTVEDAVLDNDLDNQGPGLAHVRRTAARLRRHMVPQQHALIGLLSRLPAWIAEPDAHNLRIAIERLGALGHDLDLVQERARVMQDQLSSRLMEATNRNLYILSIVTTIFLPMSLISGIFGMNLGGMPGSQDPMGFWYGMGLMVLTGAGTLVARRYRKML